MNLENGYKAKEFNIVVPHHPAQFKQSYTQNEKFLSRNCYGGGKRKSNDSDLEYDPNDAKKDKQKKRMRKYNRKRPKGIERNLQRIAAVKAANAKTNPKNNPKRDR